MPETNGHDAPRVGFYVCHCGTNIAGTVDVEAVARFAATLPGVVVSRDYKYMCSDPGQELIQQDIKEHKLNRDRRRILLTVAPRAHFPHRPGRGGLNPFSSRWSTSASMSRWVAPTGKAATAKARDLVAPRSGASATTARSRRSTSDPSATSWSSAAGLPGYTPRSRWPTRGRRSPRRTGAHDRRAHGAVRQNVPDARLRGMHPHAEDVRGEEPPEHQALDLFGSRRGRGFRRKLQGEGSTQAPLRQRGALRRLHGVRRRLRLQGGQVDDEFNAGLSKRKPVYIPFPQATPHVVLIDPTPASSSRRASVQEDVRRDVRAQGDRLQAKGRDQGDQRGHDHPRHRVQDFDAEAVPVLWLRQVSRTSTRRSKSSASSMPPARRAETSSFATAPSPRRVGIIHCVGSRDSVTNRWCSRVCCMYSLKLAHLSRSTTGRRGVQLLHRYPGGRQRLRGVLRQVHEEGVHFVRGASPKSPTGRHVPREEGKLVIRVEDTLDRRVRRIPVDMVVLAVGMEPQADSQDVRRMFNISCSTEGFFLERHPKLAPVNTFTDGIFIAGACQGPKDIPDSRRPGRRRGGGGALR